MAVVLVIAIIVVVVVVILMAKYRTPKAIEEPAERPTRVARPRAGSPPPLQSFPTRQLKETPAVSSRAARARANDARFLRANEGVEIAGVHLPGGLFYVGSAVAPLHEFMRAEPALIDPALKVTHRASAASAGELGYWPSYHDISPAQRGVYLCWLSGGRADALIDIGYVFLFFYGLERRVFSELLKARDFGSELLDIEREVERLLDLHAGQASFRRYATSFLEATGILRGDVIRAEVLVPERIGMGLRMPLLLELGQTLSSSRALPAKTALAWMVTDPSTRPRAPSTRCFGELCSLFERRYVARFGEGIVVKPNKTPLVMNYRPATSAFGNTSIDLIPSASLPDVRALDGPPKALRDLFEQCTSDLDPFSRWRGKNVDAAIDAAAAALLPQELFAEFAGSEVTAAKRYLAQQFSAGARSSSAETATALVMTADALASLWPQRGEKMSKSDAVGLAQLLEKLGAGMEPDVRFGGPVPTSSEKIVLFKLPDGSPQAGNLSLSLASLMLHLGAAVAASDGSFDERERELLERRLTESLGLTDGERARLHANLGWLVACPPSLVGLKRRLAALSTADRTSISRVLLDVAIADGRIDPGEVKALTRIYGLLDLDASLVTSDLHAAMTSRAPQPAFEPVVVARGSGIDRGFKIPAAPQRAKAVTAGIQLDALAIERKIAETKAVSSLLSAIFVDEEPVVVQPPLPTSGGVGNLDAPQSALVRALGARPSWSRSDYEREASTLGLLPDGALEALNEAAFDLCNEPLLDGDDPILVNVTVFQEMTA